MRVAVVLGAELAPQVVARGLAGARRSLRRRPRRSTARAAPGTRQSRRIGRLLSQASVRLGNYGHGDLTLAAAAAPVENARPLSGARRARNAWACASRCWARAFSAASCRSIDGRSVGTGAAAVVAANLCRGARIEHVAKLSRGDGPRRRRRRGRAAGRSVIGRRHRRRDDGAGAWPRRWRLRRGVA